MLICGRCSPGPAPFLLGNVSESQYFSRKLTGKESCRCRRHRGSQLVLSRPEDKSSSHKSRLHLSFPTMQRNDGRGPDEIRSLNFELNVAAHASGSVLVSMGNTRVICAVTMEDVVPRWMKDQGVPGGWLTAEYSMLPYSTQPRKARDIDRKSVV